MISFCTTAFNRRHQLERVLANNAAKISACEHAEWVVVDFGSSDGTVEYLRDNLKGAAGRVRVMRERSGHPWHLSFAKNVAHRCAAGAVLVSLDCDNLIGDDVEVIDHYFRQGCGILHLWSGIYPDGTCGRIASRADVFSRLGGYDEELHPMGFQDLDFLARARAMRIPVCHHRIERDMAVRNTKQESVAHCAGGGRTWRDYDRENRITSERNLRERRLTANTRNPARTLSLERVEL